MADTVGASLAPAPWDVTDSKGRVITLQEPDILQQYDFVKLLGADSKNEAYANMCLPMLYVRAIDGDAVSVPSTPLQLRALIKRLDQQGINAIVQSLKERNEAAESGADAIKK